jgi:hypothetical protein
MAKRVTREELLRALRQSQERASVLAWLIAEDYSLKPGFVFLRSPREYSCFLVFVDETRHVTYYDSMSVSDEDRRKRNAELWREHSRDGEDRHLLSLSSALNEEHRFFADLKSASIANAARRTHTIGQPAPAEPYDGEWGH